MSYQISKAIMFDVISCKDCEHINDIHITCKKHQDMIKAEKIENSPWINKSSLL